MQRNSNVAGSFDTNVSNWNKNRPSECIYRQNMLLGRFHARAIGSFSKKTSEMTKNAQNETSCFGLYFKTADEDVVEICFNSAVCRGQVVLPGRGILIAPTLSHFEQKLSIRTHFGESEHVHGSSKDMRLDYFAHQDVYSIGQLGTLPSWPT